MTPLPHFTNIAASRQGSVVYHNLYEAKFYANGKELIINLNYIYVNSYPEKWSFELNPLDTKNGSLEPFLDVNFSIVLSLFNRNGDLTQRDYYTKCNISKYTLNGPNGDWVSKDIDYYDIELKYFSKTRVPIENVKNYEREVKLNRICK